MGAPVTSVCKWGDGLAGGRVLIALKSKRATTGPLAQVAQVGLQLVVGETLAGLTVSKPSIAGLAEFARADGTEFKLSHPPQVLTASTHILTPGSRLRFRPGLSFLLSPPAGSKRTQPIVLHRPFVPTHIRHPIPLGAIAHTMDELAGLTAHLENALRQFFGIFFVAGERLVNNTKESFGKHPCP